VDQQLDDRADDGGDEHLRGAATVLPRAVPVRPAIAAGSMIVAPTAVAIDAS